LDSQHSVETQLTDLQTFDSEFDDNKNKTSDTDGCCDACTSTLRRNHRVSTHPVPPCDSCDVTFNSSREQLILKPVISATVIPSQTHSIEPAPCKLNLGSNCTNTNCSCHHGADNPTFVSDDTTLHCGEGYTESSTESNVCHDHVVAARTLMQPVDEQKTEEMSDIDELTSDAAVEMACFSLCQNGSRLVIEDLECDSGMVPSDTTLVQFNCVRQQPLDVREAWPDENSISTEKNLSDASSGSQKQFSVCTILLCTRMLVLLL